MAFALWHTSNMVIASWSHATEMSLSPSYSRSLKNDQHKSVLLRGTPSLRVEHPWVSQAAEYKRRRRTSQIQFSVSSEAAYVGGIEVNAALLLRSNG